MLARLLSILLTACLSLSFLTLSSATLYITPTSSGGHTIQDEAVSLTARALLNFTGAGVSCADNAGATRTDCTISGAAGAAYATIQNEGIGLTQRSILNMIGVTINCVDNAVDLRTDCTENGAPADAGYWVDTANATLTAERNLGALTTGLVLNTVTAGVGVPSTYTGVTCTNQFVTVLNASGVGTCTTATLASAQFANQGTTTTVLHGNAAGNPSFGTVTTGDVSGALRQHTWAINILLPTTADTNRIQKEFPNAITIQEVACSTDVGTATIQFDERARATPNTAGTDVLTASLVCDTNSEATTSFTNATIAADVPMNLQITATATAPNIVRIHAQYQID